MDDSRQVPDQPPRRIAMDLRYSGELTKEEYLAQQKLNSRPISKNNGFQFDLWILFTVIGAFFILLCVFSIIQRSSFPWYLIELLVGLPLFSLGLQIRKIPSKFWDENKGSISRADGKISDENIEVYTPNGNLKLTWSELKGYGEYKGLIVLYKPPTFALPFSERFFEKQEDWILFKEFVGSNLLLTHRVAQIGITTPRNKLIYALLAVAILIMLVYYFAKGR
jgi:hypothetical protein